MDERFFGQGFLRTGPNNSCGYNFLKCSEHSRSRNQFRSSFLGIAFGDIPILNNWKHKSFSEIFDLPFMRTAKNTWWIWKEILLCTFLFKRILFILFIAFWPQFSWETLRSHFKFSCRSCNTRIYTNMTESNHCLSYRKWEKNWKDLHFYWKYNKSRFNHIFSSNESVIFCCYFLIFKCFCNPSKDLESHCNSFKDMNFDQICRWIALQVQPWPQKKRSFF